MILLLKKFKYISGAGSSNLYMKPVNTELRLNIIFQKYKNPTVIEMEFSGLKN